MLNTGEYPSADVESTLSQILEANAPEKYYLSAKACQGILNRAERRGKKLPQMLEEALMEGIKMPPPKISGGFVGRQGAKSGSVGFEEEISPTLRQGITADVVHDICLLDSYGGASRKSLAWSNVLYVKSNALQNSACCNYIRRRRQHD